MFSQVAQQSYSRTVTSSTAISRRASKQLVQMIIGIIGILGIMLAQVEVDSSHINTQILNNSGHVVGTTVSKASAQIDWLELLF